MANGKRNGNGRENGPEKNGPPRGLGPRRERFVLEYLKDLNATAAARRAGYSARTANRTGHELLTFPDIRAAVERAKAERLERVRIDGDKVLRGFACLAFSDPGDYLTWGPDGVRLKPSD